MVFEFVQGVADYAVIKALFDVFIYTGVLLMNIVFLNALLMIARKSTVVKPKPRKDEFIKEYGYTYDYVFVFKVYEEDEIQFLNDYQNKFTMKSIIDRCQCGKIETKCFYSCQRDEIYVKMRCAPNRLLQEADRIDYKLLLDSANLRAAAKAGSDDRHPDGKQLWHPIELTDETKVTHYDPYEFIFSKYDTERDKQWLYKQYPAPLDPSITHCMRSVDRVKLLISIFEANVSESPPGCGMELGNFIAHKVVLAHFPLHNYEELQSIQKKWLVFFALPSQQPISKLYTAVQPSVVFV